MPKLNERLVEARDKSVLNLWKRKYTAEEIALMFGLTTSMIYEIIKKGRSNS